jgi:hypothetical protein
MIIACQQFLYSDCTRREMIRNAGNGAQWKLKALEPLSNIAVDGALLGLGSVN